MQQKGCYQMSRQHISYGTNSFPTAWMFWGCAALFYLYEFILRVSPNAIVNELMRDFGVTSTVLGMLVSAYACAYVPLQVPCGVIVDWLGARRVICFSTLLCIVGSVLFGQSDHLYLAIFARFLMGAGSACAYISCVKVAADWFAPEKFAMLAGITMMMGTMGGIVGAKPFAALANLVGWRDAMMVAALVGVGVLAIAFLILKDRPKPPGERVHLNNLFEGLKIISSNPQSWLIALYGGFMYVPLCAFAELWGTPFMMQLHGINNEQAAFAGTMVFLGFAFGSLLGPFASDYFQSRKLVMAASALLTVFPFGAVIYVQDLSYLSCLVLLFLAGLVSGTQILYFGAAKEINPDKYSATAIGFTNAGVMASGLIFPTLLGYILDCVWDGLKNTDGTPIYSVNDYQQALLAIPICMIIAFMILLFIKETYKKEFEAIEEKEVENV
jgi:MFS family permease